MRFSASNVASLESEIVLSMLSASIAKLRIFSVNRGTDFPRKVNDISEKKAKKRLRKIIGFVCVHA
ncbi:MAG: hypothetical protein WCI51_23000, partial [Lentisphaerota bacterium]